MPISADLRRKREHARGVRVITGDASDPSKPSYECEAYRRQIEDVLYCRAVYGGTKAVRGAGVAFLPQHPAEDDEDYMRRLARAVLFNAFRRTAHGLTGMVFRKDPQWRVEPDQRTAAETLNVDLLGHDVTVFARERMIDAIIDGHTWVVVDYPRAEIQATSLADERAAGMRPYWCPVKKQDAINVQWSAGPDGRPRLTLFAYRTTRSVPSGAFGETEVEIVRVLRPGSFEEYERTENGWNLVAEGAVTLPQIPAVFIPANETMPFESEPPLLDLAYENIDHYQIRSDHRWAAAFASVPVPFFTNMAPEDIVWGANRAIFAKAEGATGTILESSGSSLGQTRQDMHDSEARMAALGLQMLVGEKRSAETAQSKLIGKSESDSALTAMAKSVENGINRCLAMHAEWSGGNAAELALNNDYHDLELAPAQVTALSGMVAMRQLSLDTMWAALVKGEVLPDDFDPTEERERLEASDAADLDGLNLDE